ncbi:MAG TPA: asparagine synthase-related protein [Allosphingosinicella sp.]|jgi:asparagine synthetase B (glutamine-hydrolysing)
MIRILSGPSIEAEDEQAVRSALSRWDGRSCLDVDPEIAFVAWDASRRLHLVQRDSLGSGTVYRRQKREAVSFSGTMPSLFEAGDLPRLSPRGVAVFLAMQFCPAPTTVVETVTKLLPGEQRVEDAGGRLKHRRIVPAIRFGSAEPGGLDARECLDSIYRAVARRASGRAVASLLSGGIDSTTNLVGLLRSGIEPAACTASFADPAFDERDAAAEVAGHLGLPLRTRLVGVQEPGFLQHLAATVREPICDRALIPTALLLAGAEEAILVTGEGGDELWGPPRRWPAAASGGSAFPLQAYIEAISCSTAEVRARLLGDRALVRDADCGLSGDLERVAEESLARTDYERAKAIQMFGWFAENVQVKDQAAAAASGLELVLPLVHRSARAMMESLAASRHYELTRSKALLRGYLSDQVPQAVLQRPKRKFKVPAALWRTDGLMRGIEEACSSQGGVLGGILDYPALVEAARQADFDERILWGLFVLRFWFDRLLREVSARPST